MRRQGVSIAGLLIWAAMFLAGGLAAVPGNVKPMEAQVRAMEAQVLAMMHDTNGFEIELGELARAKGSTDQVRAYGDRLMRDHRMADRMVLQLAESLDVELLAPSAAASQHAEVIQQLESLQGEMFDQRFLSLMQEGHHEAISGLVADRERLMGSPLRKLLDKLIPVLVQHYEIASTLGIREITRRIPRAGG